MKFGIIGEVLKHTFSKTIHETLGGYTYEIKELAKTELDPFMKAKDFTGINVTIPYKKDVIPYLDYVDESVKVIGACNVIVNKDGKLSGYNTDYVGFVEMLKYFNIEIKGKKVAILGNGGASATVQYAINKMGAKEMYVISILGEPNTYSFDYLNENLKDVEVIVNTTPVGMFPKNDNKLIEVNNFPKLEAFCDVVYNPLKTKTVTEAEEKGIKTATGLYMLVAQAVYGIEYFQGITLDKKIIGDYYEKLVRQKENVVLVGMPTSGKTTIGKLIAEKLNRKFIDIDDEIINVIKMPISDYFKLYGEEAFRDVESDVIKGLSSEQCLVIATGGGSILRDTNVRNLKQNGRLYFLDRSLDKLITTNDRPLSSDREALTKRYNERIDIYRRVCDVLVDGDGTIEEVAKEILKEAER
ncbi:MAG: shikimate dehydrogenase [Bacilli bacterium]|nr:shikimate dehydrogenase [Bacilli bacterium]